MGSGLMQVPLSASTGLLKLGLLKSGFHRVPLHRLVARRSISWVNPLLRTDSCSAQNSSFLFFCTVKSMNDSSEDNYSAPANELERAIDLAQRGKLTEVEMINTFLAGEIVVVLNKPLAEGEELGDTQFLGFEISDGHDGVAVYTSEARVPEALDGYDQPRKTNLGGLVGALEEGVGITVNPGQTYSFEISPEGLADLKAELFGESNG
jgi:hypothetical protein